MLEYELGAIFMGSGPFERDAVGRASLSAGLEERTLRRHFRFMKVLSFAQYLRQYVFENDQAHF
ncbi:MAG: hypothetical protein J0J15_31905 [Mesorhizobium sp.]|nr:hypothetical protein [Mesorhizobium sp.]